MKQGMIWVAAKYLLKLYRRYDLIVKSDLHDNTRVTPPQQTELCQEGVVISLLSLVM